MYEQYWKLREKPFENDQNTAFFYYSREHREAFVRLLYAIMESKPCAVLLGEAGCGKTFLMNALARQLADRHVRVAMVRDPAQDPLGILRQIAKGFGIADGGASKAEIVASLEQHLSQFGDRGACAVLFIDDADTIENDRTYEELRLLNNLEERGRPLLTMVLAGQPRLREQLRRIPALAQRVAVSFTIPPLSEEESIAYIGHRLKQVEGDRQIFDVRALREVHRGSRGVPRVLNHLCDLSLLLCASEGRRCVDSRIVARALEDLKELER